MKTFRLLWKGEYQYFHIGQTWSEFERDLYNTIVVRGIQPEFDVGLTTVDGDPLFENDKVIVTFGTHEEIHFVDMFDLRQLLEESGGCVTLLSDDNEEGI